MTCATTLASEKLLSETLGYGTLSFGEGRGDAYDWESKFA